jgi:hypothetical protein
MRGFFNRNAGPGDWFPAASSLIGWNERVREALAAMRKFNRSSQEARS